MKKTRFSQNQSTPKPRSKKTIILLLVLFSLFCGGSYLALNYFDSSTTQENTDDPTAISAKEETSRVKSSKPSTDQSGIKTAEQIPTSSQLSVSGLDFQQNNGRVAAAAVVDSSTTAGECVFSFTTLEGRPVVKQSTSVTESGIQKCSVSIPEVEFDKLGQWEMVVTFYQGGTKSSATRSVNIQ